MAEYNNNKYFTYPGKELWADDAWSNRFSPILPLAHFIMDKNEKSFRISGKPENVRRTEGKYDPKANALAYPETLDYWKSKGLYYQCSSMGRNGWIAMVPVSQKGRRGYDAELDTAVVLVNADRSDPNWCMYTLEKYSDYLEAAAKENFAVLFIVCDARDIENMYINIIQQAIVIFHLNYRRFFLDISAVYNSGADLKSVPDFTYLDDSGAPVSDPDTLVSKLGGIIPVLDIKNRWANKTSLQQMLINSKAYSNAAFDQDNFMSTGVAKNLAETLILEYEYDDAEDPRLIKRWNDMGLQCDFNDKDGEQWIAFVPKGALEEPENKIPCVCIFQEVNKFDPHQAITAIAYCYQYLNIAAQGDCMLIFFALESLDDNDLLSEILNDAEKTYPIDRSRVYVTGHSHNGRFAAEFMRRHQMDIAAIATLGNEPGQLMPSVTSGFFVVTDEQIEKQASVDMPLINISGDVERNSQFPLHSDPANVRPGAFVALNTFEKRAESWQRRLRSARCPVKTFEEIAATKNSPDYVERKLGFPCDKTEVLYLDGSENYIGDIKNVDGKYHLRMVSLGNVPHTVTHTMIDLSWSFMRRFARDRETGECIELY